MSFFMLGVKSVSKFLIFLPIYRIVLRPSSRGLEIGVAHGLFLYGPFTFLASVISLVNFKKYIFLLSTVILVMILIKRIVNKFNFVMKLKSIDPISICT